MDHKKELIIQASQKLFSQFGLKKVTTDDIANEAGVSKATVYKHYNNKHKIFQDVVRIETDQMLDSIQVAVDNEKDVQGMLTAYLLVKIHKIHHLINFYRVTHNTWNEHWPYIQEVHDRFMEDEKNIMVHILSHGNSTGELAVKNVELHAHILVTSLKSIEYPWATEHSKASPKEIVELIVETFLNGVRIR